MSSDDDTMPPDYPVAKFLDLIFRIFSEKYGFDVCPAENLAQMMASKGYVNVQRKVFKLPIGGWPKDSHLNMLGHCFRMVLLDFFTAVAAKPFTQAGIDRSETEALLNDIEKITENRRIHTYMQVYFVWGQKPPA